jgi:A/G-specific adenine glycosylase
MSDHQPMVGDLVSARGSGPPAVPDPARLQRSVLGWYDTHRRPLAIRRLTDPYAIWLAETMSQQTQIGRVGEALPAFLDSFPDVAALASATAGELLRAWGGLGYPRRAMALREAARELVSHQDARVPDDVALLERLPGVGPYTARAVASTAFGVPVTALDVNARRVLGRVLGAAAGNTGRTGAATRGFQVAADALAPADRAADWNHALMDLGATVCRTAPDCGACPLATMCAWRGDHPHSGAEARRSGRGRVGQDPAPVVFRDTNRYVRGRVLASLREAPPAAWLTIDPAALSIAPDRLQRALTELRQEGFIEVDGAWSARLPTT